MLPFENQDCIAYINSCRTTEKTDVDLDTLIFVPGLKQYGKYGCITYCLEARTVYSLHYHQQTLQSSTRILEYHTHTYVHTQNAIRVDYFFFVKDNPLGKSHIMWMKCVMTDIMFIIEQNMNLKCYSSLQKSTYVQ